MTERVPFAVLYEKLRELASPGVVDALAEEDAPIHDIIVNESLMIERLIQGEADLPEEAVR